jgi:dihydroorotate dehydrogenase (NAD+) catalytic subunit
MRINLNTSFCKLKFSSPLVSVSGIVVDVPQIIRLAKLKGVGGVTTKSVSISPREGNPIPRVASFGIGYINSVGLRNPGIKGAVLEMKELKKEIKKPVIASIFAFQIMEFPLLASEIATSKPDFIELNLSCPNVDDEIGRSFATDPLLSAIAVMEVKKVVKDIPIIVKLTPNTPDLKRVAYEVEKAGADAISAINTVGPGMTIDLKRRRPILGSRVGGISGQAIKPIALRCVNDIYKTVKIPIIGIGGVSSGKDAIEMIMAGATLVGIGSAIYQGGQQIFDKILLEMKEICQSEKINSLKKIKGII